MIKDERCVLATVLSHAHPSKAQTKEKDCSVHQSIPPSSLIDSLVPSRVGIASFFPADLATLSGIGNALLDIKCFVPKQHIDQNYVDHIIHSLHGCLHCVAVSPTMLSGCLRSGLNGEMSQAVASIVLHRVYGQV